MQYFLQPKILGIALAFAAFTAGLHGEEPQPLVWLFTTDQVVWACQAQKQDESWLLRFAYRESDAESKGVYRALPIDSIVGRIRLGVAYDRNLNVFYRDGAHRRYTLPPTTIGRVGQPIDMVEVSLPDNAVPRAFTADPEMNLLFALVTAREGAKVAAITQEKIERDRDSEESDESEQKSDAPPPEPTARAAASLAFVSYDGANWTRQQDAPTQIDLADIVHAILVKGAQSHIIYSKAGSPDRILHQMAAPSWSDADELHLDPGARPIASGWQKDTPILLLAIPADGGHTIAPCRWDGKRWTQQSPIKNAAGDPLIFDSIPAAGITGNEIAIGRIGKAGTTEVGRWSLEDGTQKADFELVTPLTAPTIPQLNPATRTFISYLILMALLGAIVIWRRERIVVPAPIQPHLIFARLVPRSGAFLIDMLISAPAWGLAVYWLWRSEGQGLTPAEQLVSPTAGPTMATVWTPALVGAVFGLYAMIFELATRATPGKRIMGCSVVSEKGERCPAIAIVLRNAARIIEFHLAAVALLVLLTPSRQRVGDILARTVVVQPNTDVHTA